MNIKKTIVFITTSLGSGGAQKVMAFVANSYVRHGYKVEVVSILNEHTQVILNESIRVHKLGLSKVGGIRNLLIFLYTFKIRNIILKAKADYVILFCALPSIYCYPSTFFTKAKVIGAERDNPKAMGRLSFVLLQNNYNHFDKVVFQFPGARDVFKESIRKKSIIIPNPCHVTSNINTYDIDKTEEKIISAGRLEITKRFDVLINAFSIVNKSFPRVTLEIYGRGSLEKDLERLIKEKGLEKKVFLQGEKKDFFELSGHPMMFVLASDTEGVPNVIIEAMSRGIPCVSTDCEPGGARYLLKNGENGLISKRNDSIDLANKIIVLLQSKEMRANYSRLSFESIKKFKPDRISKMWIDLVEGEYENVR